MAAFRRRPSRMIGISLCLLGLALAGCSLVAPAPAPSAPRNDVAALVREGHHAEAALAYAALAAPNSADRDYYELKGAEQWLAAGRPAAARQALAAVSPAARLKLPVLRALVGASIALAGGDDAGAGANALRELARINPPQDAHDAREYWWLRGRGEFLSGNTVAGVRAYIARERWLTDPAAVGANRQELFSQIRAAAVRGDSFAAPAHADSVLAGWLALGPVALELERNPMRVNAALAAWQARFPDHPASATLIAAAQTEVRAVTTFPRQVALLLPLSGDAEAAGVAVRDGFISAYFQQDAASRPRVRVYDVAATPIAQAYAQALADGADFIVGPLTKANVAALAPLTDGRVPVLALNFLAKAIPAPRQFYQFALRPEDEARIVAQRLVADGRLRGVAIVPDGDWGTRVETAFTQELTRLGGAVLDAQRYSSSQINFSAIIRSELQIHPVPGGRSTHRADAAFVFIAGPPSITRLVIPQLKFAFAGDIPVYSMPGGFAPNPHANSDIDGMRFPDMPWMISADPVTAGVRAAVHAAWPANSARWDRLYAFGFDAYRLVPALRSGYFTGGAEISGMTGRLRLDAQNRIRRGLDWAQIRDGVPQPL